MRFRLTLDCDGADFGGGVEGVLIEISRILHELSFSMTHQPAREGNVRTPLPNGKVCGNWMLGDPSKNPAVLD